ncbi:MAG: hypothetical protein FWD26_02250 [Treponema sp.]|nr:hypothetical protein [Treponema sp.]
MNKVIVRKLNLNLQAKLSNLTLCSLLFVLGSLFFIQDANINKTTLPGGSYRTVEEALEASAKKAADPDRKPISRHFGKHKGIFGGDGVAYQRAIRDEWD